jgi:hypothetical protein
MVIQHGKCATEKLYITLSVSGYGSITNPLTLLHFGPVSAGFSDSSGGGSSGKKKKKLADKILPQKVRDLVPESQAYMDLLAFERKLDSTIMRKRLDIQVRMCLLL